MPKYYPLMMNLENQPVLVIGGGNIAARKAGMLLDYGAHVHVVATRVSHEMKVLAHHANVTVEERSYNDGDLDKPLLVIAATDDEELHRHVKSECEHRRIPCNVVDVPELCSFIVPSIIRRGELMITISTDGMCPAYSKYQRKRMEACCFPLGSESELHVIAAAREELKGPLGKNLSDEEKFEILRAIIDEGVMDLVAEEGEESVKERAVKRVHELAHLHHHREAG